MRYEGSATMVSVADEAKSGESRERDDVAVVKNGERAAIRVRTGVKAGAGVDGEPHNHNERQDGLAHRASRDLLRERAHMEGEGAVNYQASAASVLVGDDTKGDRGDPNNDAGSAKSKELAVALRVRTGVKSGEGIGDPHNHNELQAGRGHRDLLRERERMKGARAMCYEASVTTVLMANEAKTVKRSEWDRAAAVKNGGRAALIRVRTGVKAGAGLDEQPHNHNERQARRACHPQRDLLQEVAHTRGAEL